MTTNLHDKMLAAIDALFSASDAVEEEVAENLLLDVRDEINKHKLAEQEPLIPFRHGCKWCGKTDGCEHQNPKIGCVNHDCDQCKALAEQQEPVAVVSGYYGGQCVILPINPARIFNSNTALYTTPQPPAQPQEFKGVLPFGSTPTEPGLWLSFNDGRHYVWQETGWIEAAHDTTKGST